MEGKDKECPDGDRRWLGMHDKLKEVLGVAKGSST
jgi:hypothetical protein